MVKRPPAFLMGNGRTGCRRPRLKKTRDLDNRCLTVESNLIERLSVCLLVLLSGKLKDDVE